MKDPVNSEFGMMNEEAVIMEVNPYSCKSHANTPIKKKPSLTRISFVNGTYLYSIFISRIVHFGYFFIMKSVHIF